MSLRYCWERTSITSYEEESRNENVYYAAVGNNTYIVFYEFIGIRNNRFLRDGFKEAFAITDLSNDQYLAMSGKYGDYYDYAQISKDPQGTDTLTYYTAINDGLEWRYTNNALCSDGGTARMIRTTVKPILGDDTTQIIGNNSNQYPSDGISGDYWYVYKGSDNIDPTISYDTKQILTKETVINLTPSADNQYGGTITYDYQVNIDGNNWVDIGSTTATSMNYIIPATATQFQARVRARDNMGFTSTTWVTGPLATVRAPWVHHRLHRKNAQQVYDLVHFMTSAENVVHNNTNNVQETIDNIKQRLGLS